MLRGVFLPHRARVAVPCCVAFSLPPLSPTLTSLPPPQVRSYDFTLKVAMDVAMGKMGGVMGSGLDAPQTGGEAVARAEKRGVGEDDARPAKE